MKKIPFIFLFFYTSMISAQDFIIENQELNYLYAKVPEPVKFLSPDARSETFTFKMKNGKIIKTDSTFLIVADKPGKAVLLIMRGNKLVRRIIYNVRRTGKPRVYIEGYPGNIIPVAELGNVINLKAIYTDSYGRNVEYTIEGFELFYGQGGLDKWIRCSSSFFTEEQKKLISYAVNGADVGVTDIKTISPDGRVFVVEGFRIRVR